MLQPQWKALQLALTSSSNWLDSHVASSLVAVRALFEASPDAQQAGGPRAQNEVSETRWTPI